MTYVDEYLQTLSEPERAELQKIRDIVHANVPDVTEPKSYGIPTFKYKNKNLLHFSAFKNHMSIFPGSEATAFFSDRLNDYKTFKGTIQFSLERPIAKDLLEDIIDFRKNSIEKAN